MNTYAKKALWLIASIASLCFMLYKEEIIRFSGDDYSLPRRMTDVFAFLMFLVFGYLAMYEGSYRQIIDRERNKESEESKK